MSVVEKDDFNKAALMQNMKEHEQKTNCAKNKYHIYPNYFCECPLCKNQDDHLIDYPQGDYSLESGISEALNEKFDEVQTIQNNNLMKMQGEFGFLLQKIIPPNSQIRSPVLYVQDTVFYYNKEAYLLVYNQSDQCTLTFSKQKDKLSQFGIRILFSKRRQEFETKMRIEKEKQMNDTFSTMDKKSMDELRNIKQSMALAAPDKQFAHMFYNYQNSNQIVSQPDFNFLMERRKNDPIWGKLQFIQSCSVDKISLIEIKFYYERDREKELYKVAFEDTDKLINQQNYWVHYPKEKQFEQTLLKKSRKLYLQYHTYKIFHYAQIVNNTRIKRCIFQFAKDDLGNFYLVNCRQLCILDVDGIRHQPFFQYYVNHYDLKEQNDIIKDFQQMNEEKEKEQLIKTQQSTIKLEQKAKLNELSEQCLNYCKFMQVGEQNLRSKYIEKIYELQEKFEKVQEKIISKEAFNNLNPSQSKIDFFKLLSLGSNKDHDKITLLQKQNLLNNFPKEKSLFVKDLQIKIQLQEQEKNKFVKQPKKPSFSQIQRPLTQQNARQHFLKNQFFSLQIKEGGKLHLKNSLQDQILFINQKQQQQQQQLSEQQLNVISNNNQILTLNNTNADNQEPLQIQTNNQQSSSVKNLTMHRKVKSMQHSNYQQFSNHNNSQNPNIQQNSSQKQFNNSEQQKQQNGPSNHDNNQIIPFQLQAYNNYYSMKNVDQQNKIFISQNNSINLNARSPENNVSRKTNSTAMTPFSKKLSTPLSHLIKNTNLKKMMSVESPILSIFKNSEFQNDREYPKQLPQIFNILDQQQLAQNNYNQIYTNHDEWKHSQKK